MMQAGMSRRLALVAARAPGGRAVGARGLASQPPVDVELPGMPALSPAKAGSRPGVQVTTLPNGLRVASEDNHGSVTALGMFVDAGSRYENADNSGTSHMLEHMAFKSTETRSTLRIVRDIEDIGGHFSAASAREFSYYQGECLRDSVDTAVELLADTLIRPKLNAWDVDDQRTVIGYELEDMETSAQALLTELLHAAAYTEQGSLGMPLWCPKRNLDKLSSEQLRSFMDTHFTAPRMVLSACGIEHDKLVKLAEQHFADLPTEPVNGIAPSTAPAQYVGGDRRVQAAADLTHVTACFDVGGWKADDLIEVSVLHTLLGGGGSFSAGGPGKGMYSRLYTNVLNRHVWIDSCTAFNSMYNDGGLLGIYGIAEPQNAGRLVDVMCSELENLAAKTPSAEETSRAKNSLKSSVLMRLESRQVTFEDIGRQILSFGKHESAADVCKRIDAVTPEGLQKAAQKALKSKLTLASFGDVSSIPYYDAVAKRFN